MSQSRHPFSSHHDRRPGALLDVAGRLVVFGAASASAVFFVCVIAAATA